MFVNHFHSKSCRSLSPRAKLWENGFGGGNEWPKVLARERVSVFHVAEGEEGGSKIDPNLPACVTFRKGLEIECKLP